MGTPEARNDALVKLEGHDGSTAIVNPSGAFVESLETAEGVQLLFPRQDVNGKDRGGIPVCAPVFGPGDRVGLAQHGFARNLTWETIEQSTNGITLVLASPHLQDSSLEAYADSEMVLDVSLDEGALRMDLRIANNGDEPFVVSPGFHPYFPIKPGNRAENATVNGEWHPQQELLESRVLVGPKDGITEVDFEDGKLAITTQNLDTPVVWSANPDQYICVEPTSGGPVTAKNSEANLLEYACNPGEEKHYAMTIEWRG